MVDLIEADVVVAGSGVGGLMAAYRAQRAGASVVLLGGSGGASQRISSLNTALGYDPLDTPAGLFDDMLRAGGHVNVPDVVAAMTHRIGAETEQLAGLGVPFIQAGDRLARRQAAGSTWTRAVFTEGMVGADIARVLTAELDRFRDSGALQVKGALLIELRTQGGRVSGALAYSPRDQRWLEVRAPSVVLATGGAGQLFGTTTNPRGSRGIGYSAALEAGAELMDLEFISFEPFVTSAPESLRGQDLPTTVLREGARLRNGKNEEFLDTESAPTKDIICRAMVREVAEGRGTASGSIYFDLREMDPATANRYVGIAEALRTRGISSREAVLEVMPAQHFMMGGIRIDARGQSTLSGLYAVGEAAAGAHGGHRLAAGGGLEVVAGGAITGESAAQDALANRLGAATARPAEPRPDLLGVFLPEQTEASLRKIADTLDRGCGIFRNHDDLARAVADLRDERDRAARPQGNPFVLRSATLALAVAESALTRNESRGDHYRLDAPGRDDLRWLANLVVTATADGTPALRRDPAGASSARVDQPSPALA